jgi:hypothetical protein
LRNFFAGRLQLDLSAEGRGRAVGRAVALRASTPPKKRQNEKHSFRGAKRSVSQRVS